jgi:hypothetical protein
MGARPMNSVFGARIRSFLLRQVWWNVVQAARKDPSMDDNDKLWPLIVAGINNLSDEDYQFARSINWMVDEAVIALTNVAEYDSLQNWWYPEDDLDAPDDATLIVWGFVIVTLKEKHNAQQAEQHANAFVAGVIRDDAFANPRGRPVAPVDLSGGVGAKYAVEGSVWLK